MSDPRQVFLDAYSAPGHEKKKGWGTIIISTIIMGFFANQNLDTGSLGSTLRSGEIERGMDELDDTQSAIFEELERRPDETFASSRMGRMEDFQQAIKATSDMDRSDQRGYVQAVAREYRDNKSQTFTMDLAGGFALFVSSLAMIAGIRKLQQGNRRDRRQRLMNNISGIKGK